MTTEGEFKNQIKNKKTYAEEVWKSLQYEDDWIEVWKVNDLLDEARKDFLKHYPNEETFFRLVRMGDSFTWTWLLKWFGDQK